jgi:hypothetical protein
VVSGLNWWGVRVENAWMLRSLGLAFTVVFLSACGGQNFPDASTASSTARPRSNDRTSAHRTGEGSLVRPVFGRIDTTKAGIDPIEATDVATRLWNELVRARADRDARGLRQIETGSALAADIGYICLLGCRGSMRTADRVVVNVTHQKRWPLAFAANVTYTSGCEAAQQPCHDDLVVTQKARGAAWKIAHYITYAGTMLADQPALEADGWAHPPQPDDLLARAPTAYAAYLASLHDTGEAPINTSLASDWFAFEEADVTRAERHFDRDGFSEILDYRVDPLDPVWQFAGSNGTQLACGTVHYTETVSSARHHIVQPASLNVLGNNVLPGTYQRVILRGLHMACFEQHNFTGQISLLGEWGDVATITAKR